MPKSVKVKKTTSSYSDESNNILKKKFRYKIVRRRSGLASHSFKRKKLFKLSAPPNRNQYLIKMQSDEELTTCGNESLSIGSLQNNSYSLDFLDDILETLSLDIS